MEEIAQHLAKNVKHARSTQGLTQLQLSRRCGIPRSTIAQLETGDSNPTLAVITGLAAALNLSVEELISPPVAATQLYRKGALKVLKRGSQGNVTVAKLLPHPVPGMEIDRMEIKPGASMAGVPHNEGTREYAVCERGEVQIAVAGERHNLRAGDLLTFPGDRRHSYRNSGSKTAILFSVVCLVGSSVG